MVELFTIAKRMAKQLEEAGLFLAPINRPAFIRRFIDEFSLPRAFVPIVVAMTKRYSIPLTFLRRSTDQVKASIFPEAQLLAGVIFFVKVHYRLDLPRRAVADGEEEDEDDHNDEDGNGVQDRGRGGDRDRDRDENKMGPRTELDRLFEQYGLPTRRDLIRVWKGKKAKIVNYLHLNEERSLPLAAIDDYLKFLEAGGLVYVPKEERRYHLRSGSYEDLYLYPEERRPPWTDIVLDPDQLAHIQTTPKHWTEMPLYVDFSKEQLAPAYALLLNLASQLLGRNVNYLLKRIHCDYEHTKNYALLD